MTPSTFESAVRACSRALGEAGVPYAIIGGVAVVTYGVERATVDVDATVSGESATPEFLLAHLVGRGFEPRLSDAAAFARRSNVLLLRHVASGVPVDITLSWLPFEAELLAAAEEHSFAGTSIPVPTVTDLVVMKLVAHRPKDIGDAEQLARLHPIDFARVRRVLTEFCAVLEDESRLSTLARIETLAGR